MNTPERPLAEGSALHLPFAALAFIGLGSNLGDSLRLLRAAMDRLESFSAGPMLRSSFWQTAPVDCPPGSPDFLNAVVGFPPRAGETPESLLARLREMENEFGRRPKTVPNEPRPLDLDLVAFGQETRAAAALTLPHPRTHLRRFVLAPLAEIAGDLMLPGQSASVRELLAALPADGSVRPLET